MLAAALLLLASPAPQAPQAPQSPPKIAHFAVCAAKVHTMAGPVLDDGVVLVENGKIAAVGRAADVKIPDNVPTFRAAVLLPGLIDAHATVGLSGLLNVPHDQDQLERSAPIQPELRAVDAYNAQAGELAEPYRFLVIADLPTNFSSETLRRLAAIASTGSRCGVYTLITRDLRQPVTSGGVYLDEIESLVGRQRAAEIGEFEAGLVDHQPADGLLRHGGGRIGFGIGFGATPRGSTEGLAF